MLYSLAGTVLKGNAIIDLASNANRFHAFFLAGTGDDKFLQFTSIQFKAQEDYTSSLLSTADYLEASIGVPIVSKAVVDAVGEAIQKDITFYPCEVRCAGTVFPFYVGRILTYAQLVDAEISDFRQLTDGRQVLRTPRYHVAAEPDFFIARDQDFPYLFAASEALISLIQAKGLNIGYKPLPHQR
jgi:hypothetical protein